MIYIGSHSGQVLAIELTSGILKWMTQLPDRVESTACPSLCEEYIITGCYDGCVYVLESCTGDVYWCIGTNGTVSNDPVKSSPLCHPISGHVWFGSHDHFLYAVDVHGKEVIHQIELKGGACFSSIAFTDNFEHVITATIHGTIFSINHSSGDIVWWSNCWGPVFATPCLLTESQIACGCVDGSIYILSSAGELVMTISTVLL
jgi:acyl-CoA synthetase